MTLEVELQTYQNQLEDLLGNAGKYVLIRAQTVIGVFDTYGDALQAGYEKFRLEPFLVKRIQAVDQIQCFTREVDPCRT